MFYGVSGSTVEVLAVVAKSEDDWFDYRIENDPRFLQRVEKARESIRAGRGVKLENVK